jgi:hypothetical protein
MCIPCSRTFSGIKKPFMLKLMLGPSVDVAAFGKDTSLKLKEEYHGFRNKSGK